MARLSGFKHSEETKEKLRQFQLKNSSKYWLGKKRSEETKEKIRIKATGKKKHTESWKKELSKRMKGNKFRKGIRPHNWKGGKTRLYKKVLQRDDYTCKLCGMRDLDIMQVDHIIEKSLGGSNTLDNLQTLCPNCHARKTIKFMRLCKKLRIGKYK